MPPSKQVLDREKSTRAVVAAAEAHADDIAAALTRELTPHLHKGEALPDLTLFAHLIGRKVKADFEVLVRADRAHEAELSDDAAPREARDGAAEKVRSTLVDLRDSVNTAYGAPGLKKLGLAEAISSDPTAIASRAVAVEEALGDAAIKLPKSRRPSLKVDLKGFAVELSSDLPALVKALDDVAREEREAKVTQAAKNEAMAGHDRGFSRGAGVLTVLASYGGLDELAATIRPSTRKAGRTVAEEDPPAPGGTSSGG